MSVKRKGKWWDIDFTNKEREKVKKIISKLLLILVILGYLFYILYNIMIGFSAFELVFNDRIDMQNLEATQPDNETIILEGAITIDNDFWYSIDISDLLFNYRIITDNGITIGDYKIEKDLIPRCEKIDIDINLNFTFSELELEDFIALNSTEYLVMSVIISFRYGLYGIKFSMETKIDVEGM